MTNAQLVAENKKLIRMLAKRNAVCRKLETANQLLRALMSAYVQSGK